jgi:hypothetical protein
MSQLVNDCDLSVTTRGKVAFSHLEEWSEQTMGGRVSFAGSKKQCSSTVSIGDIHVRATVDEKPHDA